MARKFSYRGHPLEELEVMSLEQFIGLVPSKVKRSLRRMNYKFRALISKIRRTPSQKIIKTHLREMVVIPLMLGRRLQVYNGHEWTDVVVKPEMLGHRLGEYAITTKLVKHSGPGVGATRGSKAVELK